MPSVAAIPGGLVMLCTKIAPILIAKILIFNVYDYGQFTVQCTTVLRTSFIRVRVSTSIYKYRYDKIIIKLAKVHCLIWDSLSHKQFKKCV